MGVHGVDEEAVALVEGVVEGLVGGVGEGLVGEKETTFNHRQHGR